MRDRFKAKRSRFSPSLCGDSPGRFRVLFEEMAQDGDQLGGVLWTALVEGQVDILDDHGPDAVRAMFLVKQIARHGGGGNLTDMFMLANCGDFLRIQATHRNAVF